MSITYSGDPAYSDRDAVRFLLNDTSTSTGRLSDTEIEWLLSQWSNPYLAAAQGARKIAATYTTTTQSKTVGSLSKSAGGSAVATAYLDLAKALESQAKSATFSPVAPYSGGISIADKLLEQADSDATPYWFWRGMHDHPDTGNLVNSTST